MQNKENLLWVLALKDGDHQAKGLRSWCKKQTLGKDGSGRELFFISVKHRPAGYGADSYDAVLSQNSSGYVEVLSLAHGYQDFEFGISSDTSFIVSQDQRLEYSSTKEVRDFGRLVQTAEGWETMIPDSYETTKKVNSRQSFVTQTTELIEGFSHSLGFYKERSGATKDSAKKDPVKEEEKKVVDSSWQDDDFAKLFALGEKIITFEGVNFSLSEESGILNIRYPAKESQKALDFLTSRNLVLARILFSLNEKNILEFIKKFGVETISQLKDEYGRNIFHHLLEKNLPIAGDILDLLKQKLGNEKTSKMLLSGDSFHYKTPFSIAVTKPDFAELAIKMAGILSRDTINQTDLRNNTALHWAVITYSKSPNPNTLKVIGALVARGANPLIVDESVHAENALHIAFSAAFPKVSDKTVSGGRGGFVARFPSRVAATADDSPAIPSSDDKIELLSTLLLRAIYEKELAAAQANKHTCQKEGSLGEEGSWCGRCDRKGNRLAFGFGHKYKMPYLEVTTRGGTKTSYSIDVDSGKVTVCSYANVMYDVQKTDPSAKEKLYQLADFAVKCGITELGGVKIDKIIEQTKSSERVSR